MKLDCRVAPTPCSYAEVLEVVEAQGFDLTVHHSTLSHCELLGSCFALASVLSIIQLSDYWHAKTSAAKGKQVDGEKLSLSFSLWKMLENEKRLAGVVA